MLLVVIAAMLGAALGLFGRARRFALAAAGAGSIGAAVMWSLARRESTDRSWFPGDELSERLKGDRRQRLRAMTKVEERAIHERAEGRFNDLMKQ